MSYIVTAALVISKKEDGSDLYLYEGAELPDFVKADETKRLISLGMVEEVKSDEPAGDESTGDDAPKGRRKPTAESN